MSIRQVLHPSVRQEAILRAHARDARTIYNLGNEHRLLWRPGRKSVNYNEQSRQLTELRRAEEWIRKGSSDVQQSALRELDRSWKRFFENPRERSKPKFKKRGEHESFEAKHLEFKKLSHKWAAVRLPKAGFVKFRLTRSFKEVAESKSVRVKLEKTGKWSISFPRVPAEFYRERTGAITGVDRGVKHSIALSNGNFHDIPKTPSGLEKRLRALQVELSRKAKGSKRREKIKQQISVVNDKITRRRKDWVEKITTLLVREYDVIGIEDLKVQNMTKSPAARPDPENAGQYLPNGRAAKAGLNKSILANCWGLFRTRLEQKAKSTREDHKSLVIPVDPAYSSQECWKCEHVSVGNRESQAVFKCVSCGHCMNADENAALVIEKRAMQELEKNSSSVLESGYAGGRSVNGREGHETRTLTSGQVSPGQESPAFR